VSKVDSCKFYVDYLYTTWISLLSLSNHRRYAAAVIECLIFAADDESPIGEDIFLADGSRSPGLSVHKNILPAIVGLGHPTVGGKVHAVEWAEELTREWWWAETIEPLERREDAVGVITKIAAQVTL